MNGLTPSQDTLESPSQLTELPSFDEPAVTIDEPAPEDNTEEQQGMAAIFANPKDLWRYQIARANGASEQDALKVGDNGQGKWGDTTATYKTPMVALPADTPGLARGRLVKLTGPKGTTVARVADAMPRSDQNDSAADIELNPAAALAVGHPGGIVPVKWQFVTGLSDVQQTPNLASPEGISIASGPQLNAGLGSPPPATLDAAQAELPSQIPDVLTPIGEKPSVDNDGALFSAVKGLTPKTKNKDGSVTLSDGTTRVYPDLSVVFQRGDQRYIRTADGSISKLSSKSTTTDEQLMKDAAARKGILRADYPSDQEYKKAAKDALTATRAGVGTDPDVIADAIISGDQPPTLTGLYGRAGAVRTELAKKQYPLADATLDWEATKRHLATLNGPQQLRLRQATEFVRETIPLVRELIDETKNAVPRSQFPVFNAVALEAAKQGTLGPEAQNAATKLVSQITDMQSELATMYSGGNSSTDAKLKQAHDMLRGSWSDSQLNAALDLIERNSQIRLNSIKNTTLQGTGENRYLKPGTPEVTPDGKTVLPTPKPQPPSDAEIVAEAKRRLAKDPNDAKAKRVLEIAGELNQ